MDEENGMAKRPVAGIPENSIDKILKEMVGFNNKIEPYYMPAPRWRKSMGRLY